MAVPGAGPSGDSPCAPHRYWVSRQWHYSLLTPSRRRGCCQVRLAASVRELPPAPSALLRSADVTTHPPRHAFALPDGHTYGMPSERNSGRCAGWRVFAFGSAGPGTTEPQSAKAPPGLSHRGARKSYLRVDESCRRTRTVAQRRNPCAVPRCITLSDASGSVTSLRAKARISCTRNSRGFAWTPHRTCLAWPEQFAMIGSSDRECGCALASRPCNARASLRSFQKLPGLLHSCPALQAAL